MPTDEQIAIAFNAGYDMQRYDPAMVEKFLSTDDNNEIVQAVKQGAKQSQSDKIALHQQAIKERNQAKTKGR